MVSASFLQAACAAQTCQNLLHEAVPGLEVLGFLTMLRRDGVHHCLVAVLQERDREKPQEQEERPDAKWQLGQHEVPPSFKF